MKKVEKYFFPVVIISALLLLLAVAYFKFCYEQDDTAAIVKEDQETTLTIMGLFDQTNEEREKAGKKPLALDPRLNKSAQAKADDMMHYGYYGHDNLITGKHGYDWINETGIKCKPGSPAENLNSGNVTAYMVISDPNFGFMGSKSHQGAMLDPNVDLVGFGIAGDKVVQHLCDIAE